MSKKPKKNITKLVRDAQSLVDKISLAINHAEKISGAMFAGNYLQRRQGVGDQFWQYRPYRPGDYIRSIDWRRSAREEEPIVREREHMSPRQVWFWPDMSASITSTRYNRKYERLDALLTLSIAFGILLSRYGDYYGIPGVLRARCHKPATSIMAAALLEAVSGKQLCGMPEPILGRNHDLIWISDFLFPADDIKQTIRKLSGSYARIIAIELSEYPERDFPFTGVAEFVDPETGETLFAAESAEHRQSYVEDWTDHQNRVKNAFESSGHVIFRHFIGNPVGPLLYRAVEYLSQNQASYSCGSLPVAVA